VLVTYNTYSTNAEMYENEQEFASHKFKPMYCCCQCCCCSFLSACLGLCLPSALSATQHDSHAASA
jgi:hypothetical protein